MKARTAQCRSSTSFSLTTCFEEFHMFASMRLNNRARLTVCLAGSLFLPILGHAEVRAGDLDTSFSSDGIATAGFREDSQASAVAIQSDGMILVAGDTFVRGVPAFALVRFRANGALDPRFGAAGRVTTDFAGSFAGASAMALQADGKIVLAGAGQNSFAMVRYLPGGKLDRSFGTAGKVVTASGLEAGARGLALQSDGKIVVVGDNITDFSDSNADFVLMRHLTDGTLDPSFGDGAGMVTTDFSSHDNAFDVALDSNGKILVAGTVRVGLVGMFAVARYHADGDLDDTFDNDGIVTIDFGTDDGGSANAIRIQSDGKIVAAGRAALPPAGSASDFVVVRFLSDGSLDQSFNGTGIVTTDFGNSFAEANDLGLQADGKIVAGGGGFEFDAARYLPDGSLDAAFGGDGKVALTFTPDRLATVNALAIQPLDGRLVLAGWAPGRFGDDFADFTVVRLHTAAIP
jgi:uncharacterized delta-60 repeat protein